MKYIFDFDDVIFDSIRFKQEKLFPALVHKGVTAQQVQEVYKKGFTSPENLFKDVALACGVQLSTQEQGDIVENLFTNLNSFLHADTVELIKQKGKSDCVILSLGDTLFQKRKISETGLDELVSHVKIVQDSKKDWVIDFSNTYTAETVYFIDNTEGHLNHPEFSLLPNLKTVLYVGPESLREVMTFS